MNKSILFALAAVLVITFVSCSKQVSENQEQTTPVACHVTPCTSNPTIDDDTLPEGWIVDTLYTYTRKDGSNRLFLDVFYNVPGYWENYHGLYAVDDNPSDTTYVLLKYPRYKDVEDFFSYIGGVPDHLLYLPCEDNKSLYVITRVNANSNGWVSEYQLFIVNMETLEQKYIAEFAAIEATEEGFRIAVARLTNEETATCTADEDWVMHDEYLDWSGKVTRVDSAEYDYPTLNDKYLNGQYTLVRGFYGYVK